MSDPITTLLYINKREHTVGSVIAVIYNGIETYRFQIQQLGNDNQPFAVLYESTGSKLNCRELFDRYSMNAEPQQKESM